MGDTRPTEVLRLERRSKQDAGKHGSGSHCLSNQGPQFLLPGATRKTGDARARLFTPKIDTPAASALNVIISNGVKALTDEQRIAWARFLLSFGVRTPETLREMGRKEAIKGYAAAKQRAKGPAVLERKVDELIDQLMPALERNTPLAVAMDILTNDFEKMHAMLAMGWWSRRWNRKVIAVGDRPLLAYPRMQYPCGIPLDNPDCLIVLPIAPNMVFFASANPRTRAKIRAIPPTKLAKIINDETIWRATDYVFAFDRSLADFIKERFAGKAKKIWQPSGP